MPDRSLRDVFDRNLNALNALRLLLAIGVIFWHSFALTGREVGWPPLAQILGQVWVDGFFAISGFLILGSWMNNPSSRRYLRARCLRILPAFYVCLIVTAGVIAPIGIVLSGHGAAPYTFDSLTYVAKNAALWIFQFDIAGSPQGVPYPGAWNGSLWTLFWEFLCYVAVLLAGVVGLLRYRSTIAVAFAGSWMAVFVATTGLVDSENFGHAARFGLAFTAGALIFRYQRALPVSWLLVIAALGVTGASSTLPNYQLVAAPFLAYALIGAGALIKRKRWVLQNDMSYGMYIYAFPVQQLLAIVGASALPVWAFTLASIGATLPLAAMSWFGVEQPVMRWGKRTTRKSASLRHHVPG